MTTDDRLTLVVLDDLHWADAESLALLRYLLQGAVTIPVLVLATFRDTDTDASHPLTGLLADAHREPGCTRLALNHLDDVELMTLLENISGQELDQNGIGLRDALREETEGNPFFVTEILRHLIETGVVRQDEGRWTLPFDLQAHGLPVSVREVVCRRVERLGPETRRALDTASIIGRDFELDLLAGLLDEPAVRTFECLAPAIDVALVTDSAGQFSFAHAIVGHTLYEELSPTARAFGHEAIAGALEQVNDHDDNRAAEIAHHWARTMGPSSTTKAAEYARRAGEHALAHLAPDEALRWFRQALELAEVGGANQRGEILVGLGIAQRQVGDSEHRETLLEAGRLAINLGDDDLLVRSALANNRGETSEFGGVDDERIEMLRAAIAVRPTGPDGALLHAILSIELADGSDDSVETTAAHAIELALETGDDRVTARVVRLAESSLRGPETLSRRQEWLQLGVAAAERTGDPLLIGLLSISHHEIALERGDRVAMDREQLERDAFAKRSPEPWVRWTNEQTRFTHHFLDGDLEAAEATANVCFELGISTAQPEAFSAYAGQLFQLRRAQDRLNEVAGELEQFVAANPSFEVFGAALAYMWCQIDRHADARGLADELSTSHGGAPKFWSTTLMLWAEVCHTLAMPEAAARLVPALDGLKNQVASTGVTTEGSIAHGLGRALAATGRTDEAANAYDLALDANERLGAPLFVARTRLAQAELFSASQPDRSVEIVNDVRSATEHLDFGQINRQIDQLLKQLGTSRS